MANPAIDDYVSRSERWPEEIGRLRTVLLDTGLTEELKWRKPCYCHDGANIAIVQEMKDFLALMFFKGALLRDPDGVLEDQGPNSRSAKRVCFRSVDDVDRLAPAVANLVDEAVRAEARGLEVDAPPEPELVEELRDRLAADPELEAAFESLTPGRRREYHLYVSGAKQSSTRTARIDKCAPRILAGKGLRDR
jgi:uncharacterized protein YdeI (YjbR/CyaY-like superfamily)